MLATHFSAEFYFLWIQISNIYVECNVLLLLIKDHLMEGLKGALESKNPLTYLIITEYMKDTRIKRIAKIFYSNYLKNTLNWYGEVMEKYVHFSHKNSRNNALFLRKKSFGAKMQTIFYQNSWRPYKYEGYMYCSKLWINNYHRSHILSNLLFKYHKIIWISTYSNNI